MPFSATYPWSFLDLSLIQLQPMIEVCLWTMGIVLVLAMIDMKGK